MNDISADKLNKCFTEGPVKIVTEYINEAETDYVHQNLTESVFSIPVITKNDASKLINGFSSAKSSGSDGISIRLIKTFKFVLLSIIVLIMNLSIKNGFFPTLWKTAKICPLFKSGDKKDVNN
jgi:hypothetical protein